MAPRPPNYANDRSQRERAQRQKADEKAQKRAEKSAKRKAADGTGDKPPEGKDGA
jgi:hypothetical protein